LTVTDQLWTGGLDLDLDYMFPTKPEDPEMRESASIWLFEENGKFALPRVGLEAQGVVWDNHRFDANVAFADGRVLRESVRAPTLSPIGPDGKASVLGAGGLKFRCIEPFHKWAVSYDGQAYDGTVQEQIRSAFAVYADGSRDKGLEGRRRAQVSFDVELTMVTPAWVQDYRTEKLAGMSEQERIDAGLMGYGYRIEHLFRGEGVLTVDGQTQSFKALGSRIHRQSVRPMGEFRGHCWQSAVFPDGRAFGYIAYPPRVDGSTYNEGYVYQNGKMYPARATRIPFLRNITPQGDDVSLELESELGVARIEGATTLATFHIGNPGVNSMNNQQGGVRYTWDGMTTYGMIERSSPADLTKIIL
jgi:prepilin-type processing-associated H-X9-DG protein